MKLTNNEQWILDYLKVDILPRALVVGVCQSGSKKYAELTGKRLTYRSVMRSVAKKSP